MNMYPQHNKTLQRGTATLASTKVKLLRLGRLNLEALLGNRWKSARESAQIKPAELALTSRRL